MVGEGQTTPVPPGGAICARDPKDMAAIRRAIADWPERFSHIPAEKRRRWLMEVDKAVDDAELIEDPCDRGNLRVNITKTGLMLEKMEQADQHKAVDAKQRDQEIGIGAAGLLASLTDDDLIQIAKRTGTVDQLPPALRERAAIA